MTPEALQQAEVERRQHAVDIARLQEQMKNLAERMAETQSALVAIGTRLDEMSTTLTEARGGWRTLMWLGGAAASLGGLLTWVLTHFTWSPK